jgi:hypothetical protein
MHINTNIDYESLLLAAIRKWGELDAYLNRTDSSVAPEVFRERDARRDEYYRWMRENFEDRGLTLHTEPFTGRPVSISITVAGKGG